MSNHRSHELNMQTTWEIALRHKKKIVLLPLLFVAAGALFFLCCPRTYRSEARLFLRVGRETVGIDPTATTGQTLPLYTSDRMDEVTSAQEVFRSRSVASQVVDRLGPDVVLGRGSGATSTNFVANLIGKPKAALMSLMKSLDPISEREEAIIAVERGLFVGGERQATVIVVEYSADSPQLAQTVCQTIVDVAQQEHIRVHRSEESSPFFTEQQQRLRDQLELSLESLRDAKDAMGLADVAQRRMTLEAQYNAIELDRLSSKQQLATADARIDDLERQLAEVPERLLSSKKSVPNHGADLLRDRFYELQVSWMDLKSRYHDAHPFVRAANVQLQEAQKVLAEQAERRMETTDDVNPIHRELAMAMKQERSIVAGLRSRLVELEQQKQAVLADLRTVNQHDLKIDQLTRDVELARDKYMQYARTMEEARIDKELQNEGVSNISVAQAASLAEKPVIPARGLTIAATFVLATAGTIGLVLLGERQHSSAPTDSEVYAMERRTVRRRVRRALVKTNGRSDSDEVRPAPK